MLFSSTTLVLVTEKKYFVNQCNYWRIIARTVSTDGNGLFRSLRTLLDDEGRTIHWGKKQKCNLMLYVRPFIHQLQLLVKLKLKDIYLFCILLTASINHWNVVELYGSSNIRWLFWSNVMEYNAYYSYISFFTWRHLTFPITIHIQRSLSSVFIERKRHTETKHWSLVPGILQGLCQTTQSPDYCRRLVRQTPPPPTTCRQGVSRRGWHATHYEQLVHYWK
jgi:hypothetical protein